MIHNAIAQIYTPPCKTHLGKSFPFCETSVADLARTPPDADLFILLIAAEEPVLGPDAL